VALSDYGETGVLEYRRVIQTLEHARKTIPPLKKFTFEAFWLLFAIIEMIRFLRSLL
jgi:hypothetical protein